MKYLFLLPLFALGQLAHSNDSSECFRAYKEHLAKAETNLRKSNNKARARYPLIEAALRKKVSKLSKSAKQAFVEYAQLKKKHEEMLGHYTDYRALLQESEASPIQIAGFDQINPQMIRDGKYENPELVLFIEIYQKQLTEIYKKSQIVKSFDLETLNKDIERDTLETSELRRVPSLNLEMNDLPILEVCEYHLAYPTEYHEICAQLDFTDGSVKKVFTSAKGSEDPQALLPEQALKSLRPFCREEVEVILENQKTVNVNDSQGTKEKGPVPDEKKNSRGEVKQQ